MIPKLSFIPQALDKWFEKGDNYISVEEIRLKQNIGIFRNTASHFFARSTEERGENPRRRNGTVNVGKEAFGAKAQPLAKKRGRRKATARQTAAEHKVRIFGSVSFWQLSCRSVCKCIKTFAPRFEKTLVLFYCGNHGRKTDCNKKFPKGEV